MENDITKNEFGFEVLGFCGYCNGSIHVGDDYVVKDGSMYHTYCSEVKDKYYDPLDVEDDN